MAEDGFDSYGYLQNDLEQKLSKRTDRREFVRGALAGGVGMLTLPWAGRRLLDWCRDSGEQKAVVNSEESDQSVSREGSVISTTTISGTEAEQQGSELFGPNLIVPVVEAPEIVSGNTPEITVVDGVETFGIDAPYDRAALEELFTRINAEQKEVDPDTFYHSNFISESSYKKFDVEKYGSFESFLRRQVDMTNSMVESANKEGFPLGIKMDMRRLIVVKDGTEVPNVYTLQNQMNDTDGGWYFRQEYKNVTDEEGVIIQVPLHDGDYPELSAYFDEETLIERGLIHEWGHSVLHLPDLYWLNASEGKFYMPGQIESVPSQWMQYRASDHDGIGPDLMMDTSSRFSEYTALQLERRRQKGKIHEVETVIEVGGVSDEVPKLIEFDFQDAGKNAQVEIYRKCEREHAGEIQETLEGLGTFACDDEGRAAFSKDMLFEPIETDVRRAATSTYFIRLHDTAGEAHYRWIDIRDFNLAAWKGYEDGVSMKLSVGSATDMPEDLDWKIEYGAMSEAGYQKALQLAEELDTDLEMQQDGAQKINGIDTYGTENPLTAEQLRVVTQSGQSSGEKPGITVIVPAETYAVFDTIHYGGNLQTFLKRHESLVNAGQSQQSVESGNNTITIQKLVVLAAGQNVESVGTSGVVFLDFDPNELYKTQTFDKSKKTDPGLISTLQNAVVPGN